MIQNATRAKIANMAITKTAHFLNLGTIITNTTKTTALFQTMWRTIVFLRKKSKKRAMKKAKKTAKIRSFYCLCSQGRKKKGLR